MKLFDSTTINPLPVTLVSRIMLATCGLLLLGLGGLRAQSNSEYTFRQQVVDLGEQFSADEDDVPNLSMDCLAANGYGQWTISSAAGTPPTDLTTNFPAGWYLLGNGLYQPSVRYDAADPSVFPGCFPPGVVDNNTLDLTPTEPKATANLDGWTNYVWPNPSPRNTFDIREFGPTDVDISLGFLLNPVVPSGPRPWPMDIIQNGIHTQSASTHTTTPVIGSHAVVMEGDFRDDFDVCSDASFLYIVWASTVNPVNAGMKEIWVAVLPLGSSSTFSAAFPMFIDDGEYPTITCDPRNNRNGGMSPAFDVAYIQASTGNIKTGVYSGGTLTLTTVTQSFYDPNNSPCVLHPWEVPLHARIVRSSVFNGTSSLSLYAIVNSNRPIDGYTGNQLIYYQPGFGAGTDAAFVAGVFMLPPAPIIASVPVTVLDKPITAFADPYDNQSGWHTADEVHCVYQYDLGAVSPEFPIVIIRGFDNGGICPSEPPPAPIDTRLLVNETGGAEGNDPLENSNLSITNWYVAAVNQMGIHIHWSAIDPVTFLPAHFYSRDTSRTFDESIDENTLVTDICTVSDGSSTGTDHGGDVGAVLENHTRITVWTDPNYGADASDLTGNSGLFQPRDLVSSGIDMHVGQLDFTGDNVVLQIGGLTPDDGGAILAVMPYFYFNFAGDATDRGVTVGPYSTFDYFGLIAEHNSDGTINFLATPFTDGYISNLRGAGTISLAGSEHTDIHDQLIDDPAYLNIHGDADFMLGVGGQLLSNLSDINVEYDGSIFPLDGIPAHTGHASLHGYADINNSTVQGNIPADSSAPIFTVLGYEAADPQFDAENSSFYNSDNHGSSEVLIEPWLKPFEAVIFNQDYMTAMKIHAINPENFDYPGNGDITIENTRFYKQHGRTIFVENTGDPLFSDFEGSTMTITGNYFYTIDSHIDPDDDSDGTYGIYIKGIDDDYDGSLPDMEGDIVVEDNTFNYNNWSTVNPNYPKDPNIQYSAAICFENTTGNILGNSIKDPAYNKGIWLMATLTTYETTVPATRTLVCNNTIQLLHPPVGDADPAPELLTGIRTEYYNGYLKLNAITDCEIGLDSYGDDATVGNLVFNTIDNTHDAITYDIQQAIRVHANSSLKNKLDLSGVHGGGNDYGGFNDISGTYSDWETGLITVGCNAVFNLGSSLTGGGTDYGDNNLRLCTGPKSGCTQPSGTYAYIIKGLCGTANALQDIDHNFWGLDGSRNKIDPANNSMGADPEHWNAAISTQLNSLNISYSPIPSNTLGAASTFSGVECGSGLAITHREKGPKPLSIQSVDSCQTRINDLHTFDMENEFVQEFDSSKYVIEHCTSNPNAIEAVGNLSTAVQYGGGGPLPQAAVDEKNYLLSILQLKPGDPDWFCGIANQMPAAPTTAPDTSWQQMNTQINKGLSLLYWIIKNSPCPNFGTNDTELYDNSRGSEKESWRNSGCNCPWDSTIYSMHDLGLDSLLKYAALLGVNDDHTPSIITNASAYPNPTGEGTILSFGTSKEAYVLIELFDVLGHKMETTHFESVLQPGNHEVPISLSGLPSGTYYARIQTTYGEAQTVKLVKE